MPPFTHDALAGWIERGVCVSACVSGVRHAWVHELVYMPCVGLCTPHFTTLSIIWETTHSCETNSAFWTCVKTTKPGPVPLDPVGREVMRWCWMGGGGEGACVVGEIIPSSHGGPPSS